MSLDKKYLEALKATEGWVKVSEWAIRVGKLFPDVLEKAEIQAANQASETTGLREIAARISSRISSGAFSKEIEIDYSEKPRLVRYLQPTEQATHEEEEIEEDLAPLKRSEIIKKAADAFNTVERYRVSEFEAISAQLKQCFALSFEVDHAKSLLNQADPGPHHPDNLQLLLKAHNGMKNNHNWERFSVEEQIEYIEAAIKMQSLIATRLKIELVD
jgi:hypothetical protein